MYLAITAVGSNLTNMKRITDIIMTLAAAICFAASCQKDEVSLDKALVGTWHLEGTIVDGEELKENVDVYLQLNSDCTFHLYQKTGSQKDRYDLYTGVCSAEGGVLSGTYESGDAWGSSYKYKVSGSTLTLKSSDNIEEQVYTKASLPADMKLNTATKAEDFQSPIL